MKKTILIVLLLGINTFVFAQSFPLWSAWQAQREDNFSATNEDALCAAMNIGYTITRIEGYVLQNPGNGTARLRVFWNSQRGDNFTTATDAGVRDAQTAGYTEVQGAIAGYVFISPTPGMVALNTYWNSQRGDNFTTTLASPPPGYTLVRVEGYIYPGTNRVPLQLYWNSQREDNFSTGSLRGGCDARLSAYTFSRLVGTVLMTQEAGTIPLRSYYHAGRGDNATTTGMDLGAGYTLSPQIEGYIYTSQISGTVPLYLHYNEQRQDYFTTTDATVEHYNRIRIEGYVFPNIP
jgi:hypothetical protein